MAPETRAPWRSDMHEVVEHTRNAARRSPTVQFILTLVIFALLVLALYVGNALVAAVTPEAVLPQHVDAEAEPAALEQPYGAGQVVDDAERRATASQQSAG